MAHEANEKLDLRPALWTSALIVLAMAGLSAWAWYALPEDTRIPVHWGPTGEPDRYGGKAEALLVMPVVTIVLTALMALIPIVEPRRAHLAKSGKAFIAVWIGTLLVLAIAHVLIIAAAMGYEPNVHRIILIAVGLLFALIGIMLPNMESNYFMGIRTPWTLSSELSWRKTHWLGGRLFLLLGLLFFVTAWLPPSLESVVIIVVLSLAFVGILVVYSYLVWRGDPAR